MAELPKEIALKATRITTDSDGYRRCMTIIKARMFTIQKILNNEINIPILMFKVETVYLQFRMLFELLYLSSICVKKKKYSQIWPRSEKEYQPVEIQKFLMQQPIPIEETFPYPYVLKNLDGNSSIELQPKPITEEEIYRFFNKTHQYLHEPNPYKKKWEQREAECNNLLKDAEAMLHKLWKLLGNHIRVSELDDGEGAPIICDLGFEDQQVTIAELIPGGKKA